MFHELAEKKDCEIMEKNFMSDHVNLCIRILPKYVISNVAGFI